MPDPKYLHELKIRAENALNSEPPDGLTGFTTAWTLWDAIKLRVLILACEREGWSAKQARDALTKEPIDQQRFLTLYETITSGQPWERSLPIPAVRIWPGLAAAEQLRRRIIHGTTRVGEERLQRTAWKVLRFVDVLRDHPLGNPMRELPGKSGKPGSEEKPPPALHVNRE